MGALASQNPTAGHLECRGGNLEVSKKQKTECLSNLATSLRNVVDMRICGNLNVPKAFLQSSKNLLAWILGNLATESIGGVGSTREWLEDHKESVV